MVKLQTSDPKVWESFIQGNVSCQRTQIPGTALGRDHAGEQVNKVLKTRGSITGITRNENSSVETGDDLANLRIVSIPVHKGHLP